MQNFLEKIVFQKRIEVADLYKNISENKKHPLHFECKINQSTPFFEEALRSKGTPSVISEIKRRSPALGDLAAIASPEALALNYAKGGAAAISVLTDKHFLGSLEDLKQVKKTLDEANQTLPILRKDFIVDTLQLKESVLVGASAVLLIVSILKNELESFLHESHQLGLEAFVEVHTRGELDIALAAGATLIGVNQRNLNSFQMHPEVFEDLAPYMHSSITRVAASGVSTRQHSQHVASLGYHSVLVGEALVRSSNPTKLIQALRGL